MKKIKQIGLIISYFIKKTLVFFNIMKNRNSILSKIIFAGGNKGQVNRIKKFIVDHDNKLNELNEENIADQKKQHSKCLLCQSTHKITNNNAGVCDNCELEN